MLGRQLLSSTSAIELQSARWLKQTTGIVGLEVVDNARDALRQRCQDVLKAVQVLPEDTAYRKSVESTMTYRISQTDSQGSDEDIEQHFGLQLEQLIEHCKDELILIPQMAEWKPWDVPSGHKVEMIIEEDVPEGEALPRKPTMPE